MTYSRRLRHQISAVQSEMQPLPLFSTAYFALEGERLYGPMDARRGRLDRGKYAIRTVRESRSTSSAPIWPRPYVFKGNFWAAGPSPCAQPQKCARPSGWAGASSAIDRRKETVAGPPSSCAKLEQGPPFAPRGVWTGQKCSQLKINQRTQGRLYERCWPRSLRVDLTSISARDELRRKTIFFERTG